VDQKKNEIQWQRSFLIDKNRLGKKYGDRGVPGAFLVTFSASKKSLAPEGETPPPPARGAGSPQNPLAPRDETPRHRPDALAQNHIAEKTTAGGLPAGGGTP